ncbi:MAG: T9SS type A sorting domain-containing protein [Balneolaceae bacterium]|nr:T9SS type A sorting domain-containing protein [Balneolaceae bacterium]
MYFKKHLLTLSSLLLLTVALQTQVWAQVVTFSPSFATSEDSLRVVLDATQGNQGLENFDGRVYLHTGLITSNSTTGSDWKYVPFGWETNDASVEATDLGDNKWAFTYKPSIREFFGVTDPNEVIEQVAIVYKGVRNGAIVAEGKDEGNADIFIELTAGEAAARFVTPDSDYEFMKSDGSLDLVGIGTVVGGDLNLELFKNDVSVATTTDDTLRFTYVPQAGDTDIEFDLVASNGANLADTASFFVTVRENDGAVVARPNGLEDGITYNSDTSVQLSLYAPGKDFIYVIGDFNNWTPSSEYLMKKDIQGGDVWYWTEIDGLTAGQQYGMQYLVDGEITIADPYSELVLDEFNDQFISDDVFPNLKPYPTGKTSHMVSVLTPGEEEYEWEVTDFDAPDNDKLVNYKLLLRDFIADHSYSTLIDTLDYIANLGVNAIEFLPVNEFDGNESWGYNPAFHLALDKYYGTPNEFKRFVDEAHKRGIAVILDVVLNHSFGQNPLVRLWNEGDFGNPTAENPYFNTAARHPFNVGYDFNHESSKTRYYSKRVMEYWIEEYKVDGYRFDLSKGFTQTNNPNDVGAWGNYDQSRVDIWLEYYAHIKSVDPEAYVILEHFADNNEEKVLADAGMLLWGNSNSAYNEATMGYNDGGKSNLNGVRSSSRGFQFNHLVSYMESHDEQWLMFKNRSFGNSSGDYNIRELGTALDRMELAGVFFFPIPGPRMIWQFGELGYGYGDAGEQCLNDSDDCPASAPGRTANKPIRWDYNEDPDRKDLYNTWASVIKLRNSSEAFTRPDNATYALSGSVKYYRYEHTDSDVVAIGNFGVTSTTQQVDFTQGGIWYDFFNNSTIDVNGETNQHEIALAPGEYRLFTTKEFNMSVSAEEEVVDNSPNAFKLYQNYPNPFNPSTNITFDVAEAGFVSVEVFNLLGQKVANLVQEPKAAGSYTVRFDASGLSSGIYIYRLTSGNVVKTQKMMLMK